MTEEEARQQAKRERAEFLRRLQANGDRMAEELSRESGVLVEFELHPSLTRREPDSLPDSLPPTEAPEK